MGRILVVWLLFAIASAGCSTSPVVRSHPGPSDDAKDDLQMGVYYLPRKLIRIHLAFDAEGKRAEESGNDVVSALSEMVVHGKPIRLTQSAGRDYADKIKIETVDGFLSKVTNDSQDMRPAAVAAVADGLASVVGKPGAVAAEDRAAPRANLLVDELVDPLGTDSVNHFNARFEPLGIRLEVVKLASSEVVGSDLSREPSDGVVYPVAMHHRFLLTVSTPDEAPFTFVMDSLVPSTSEFLRVDISRTAWVQHKTTIEFDQGIFKSADVERGSVTQSVAMLPIDVLRAIFSIPTSLVQLRVNHLSGDASVLDQEADLARAKRELIDAELALEKKKKEEHAGDAPEDD